MDFLVPTQAKAASLSTAQLSKNEVAAAYQAACSNHHGSGADAAAQFVSAVGTLLDETADSDHFSGLLRAARDYDVDKSFSHLPQIAHA